MFEVYIVILLINDVKIDIKNIMLGLVYFVRKIWLLIFLIYIVIFFKKMYVLDDLLFKNK